MARARDIQRARFAKAGLRTNAEAEGELLDSVAKPNSAGQKLLTDAAERMRLTARGYHRVLRVARTIADLAGATRSTARISPRPSATAASITPGEPRSCYGRG